MQPAGYGGLDHERTPLQRPRFSRQAVLAAPLFAAVAGLVILVVLELAPESALHRASLASALQAPITADHHHRNITSAAPHIVLAVLDDAGWDDWLETSDLAAPHVAALAESGLSLRSHYAAHECTPSRGSLLSGRYPVRLGLQRGVVSAASKWGLDPAIRLLPETLQTAGYRTALVGKWHLGHYNESLTPARRGFGESYGFLGGFVDHFTHVAEAPPACASETPATDGTCALDWQVNGLPRPRATGVYAAYACRDAARRLVASHEGKEEPLFLYYALPTPHEPITPPDDVETYELLPKLDVAGRRRDYAAVVAATDGAIGDLQAALQKHALWPNTLLVLLSDNGASAAGGSNAPLRGAKGGYFEGGVRTRALLAGSLLPQNVRGSSHEGLVHVADWAPTLLNAAGLRPDLVAGFDAMDGVDQWDALRGLSPPPRDEVLLGVDDAPTGGGATGAIRRGKWKLLVNVRREPVYDGCSDDEVRYLDDEPRSFLYDVEADPGESEDVYDAEPDIAAALEKRLVELHVAAEAPRYCAPTRAELDGARAAFAARGNVVQPWASLVRTGDRSHCDDARRDADAIRADSCARGLLAPAACDGARSARS